jgi:threonine dehydrogenase-like Zn-dependent dehydrogenase
MPRELLLTEPRTIQLVRYDDPPLTPDQVRAEAVVSGISHGTELALYRGISPFEGKRFDLDLRLFVDEEEGGSYPMRLGYEWVGVVTDVGEEVQGVGVGDLVHLARPHRETQTVTIAEDPDAPWTILPGGFASERATFLRSTAIALQAVHDARIALGARLVVFGLGTFGLLVLQLARLSGAAWIAAVDPIGGRRDLARRLGADLVLDPSACDAGREVKVALGRSGADVVIEFSGRYAALHEAMRCVRLAGTVVAAGFYLGEAGSGLRLGEEWHHNRLTLVGSMSGWGAPHREVGWNRRRLGEVALALLADGRLDVDALITQRVPFERAAEAYQLIDGGSDEALRVVLTYREQA